MVGLALPRGASTPAAASEEVCIRSNFAHAAADGAGLVGAVPPLVAGAVQQLVAKSACGLCRGQWANAEGDERH